jgi:hypothetical protein
MLQVSLIRALGLQRKYFRLPVSSKLPLELTWLQPIEPIPIKIQRIMLRKSKKDTLWDSKSLCKKMKTRNTFLSLSSKAHLIYQKNELQLKKRQIWLTKFLGRNNPWNLKHFTHITSSEFKSSDLDSSQDWTHQKSLSQSNLQALLAKITHRDQILNMNQLKQSFEKLSNKNLTKVRKVQWWI